MADNPGKAVLLTRPKAQAQAYADELRRELPPDVAILVSPLMRIQTLPVEIDLGNAKALAFTSANGVRSFANATKDRSLTAYCVGNATAEVAKEQGLKVVSADGDASDLIRLLASVQGPILHPRGTQAAVDLAQELRQSGHQASDVVLYSQQPQALSQPAKRLLASQIPVAVPLFSPRTAENFVQQISTEQLSDVTLICISDTVARQMDAVKVNVRIAVRPDAKSITREIAAWLKATA